MRFVRQRDRSTNQTRRTGFGYVSGLPVLAGVGFLCLFATGGSRGSLLAQEAHRAVPALGAEAPFDVTVSRGTLSVAKVGDFAPIFVVKWNGRLLNTFSNDQTVTLRGVTGETGNAEPVLLLEFAGQGVDCPYHYRILDLTVKPTPYLTGDIGDCSLAQKMTTRPNGFSVTLAGWKFPQYKVPALEWSYEVDGSGKPGRLHHVPALAKGDRSTGRSR